jgi:hypothetical protein
MYMPMLLADADANADDSHENVASLMATPA